MRRTTTRAWMQGLLSVVALGTLYGAITPQAHAEGTGEAAPALDPWLVMDTLHGTSVGTFIEKNRINLYGWTQGSYTASSAGKTNTPLLFQNPAEEFLLNQNWLVFERTVDTSASEPTFGFHSAWMLPGSDARYTISRGLFDGQTGRYRIDPFHMYAEAYFPSVMEGMSLIAGKNAVPHFFEVQDAALNPLFSHSYIYYYGGPFTHTAIQAKVKTSKNWSFDTRLATGSDIWFDEAASPTGIGSALYTSDDQRTSVLMTLIAGQGTYDQGEEFNHYNLFDTVITHKLSDALTYVADAMVGYQRNVPEVSGTATWYGIANYLTYSLCHNLSSTTRVELFKDQDGTRTGAEGLYTEVTTGLNIQLRKDVILRPEIRYDYSEAGPVFDGDRGMFTASTDLILRW